MLLNISWHALSMKILNLDLALKNNWTIKVYKSNAKYDNQNLTIIGTGLPFRSKIVFVVGLEFYSLFSTKQYCDT